MHSFTHTASVSQERLGRLLSFFGSWLESQQLLGFSPNMGRGLFFFHVRTCTPLFCISGTTSAIMSKFRIGMDRVGSWVGVVVGIDEVVGVVVGVVVVVVG